MKIDIELDNIHRDQYSAIIEDEGYTSSKSWNVYEILEPIGYGDTPRNALQSLVDKLNDIDNKMSLAITDSYNKDGLEDE